MTAPSTAWFDPVAAYTETMRLGWENPASADAGLGPVETLGEAVIRQ
jgi:hypothetical protein